MNTVALFKSKISEMLFLEINADAVNRIFETSVDKTVYMPVKASAIISKVKSDIDVKDIPVNFFIEGMFFILGCDKDFVYNDTYLRLLSKSLENWSKVVKSKIYRLVKEKAYIEAYILLKGLLALEKNIDNYSRLLWLADSIRNEQKDFKEEELNAIEEAKELDFPDPYLYETLIFNEDGKYREALVSIETYLHKGGQLTEDIINLKNNFQNSVDYDAGKEHIYSDPEKALKLLLPLLDNHSDNALLFYNIAIAYRLLNNHEKAIYYLNEAVTINSSYAEIIHELGLNYACLSNFDQAILYFRRAFEVTHSIEICTNLIMCYINKGDLEQAKLHLSIAEKINPNDEIMLLLKSQLEGEKG